MLSYTINYLKLNSGKHKVLHLISWCGEINFSGFGHSHIRYNDTASLFRSQYL